MACGTYVWATRCIPGFSVLALIALLVAALAWHPYGRPEKGIHHGEATWPQLVLGAWTFFLHILSVAFPLRSCFAMRDVFHRMTEVANVMPNTRRRRVQSIKNEEGVQQFPVPLFCIILPNYKEDMETLEETLRVMASHPQARYSYHVFLAMEEKEEKAEVKAASLISTFESQFFRMSYTMHPEGIPGESQGKSSNEAWAAKEISRQYTDELVRKNTIITTMDADTHLSQRYFTQIARLHTEHAETNESCIYVPPIVFDRNLHHVPLFVRTADLMWAGAGISSLYTGSTVCIPTSVYSLPMTLVEHVGGWDTDPGSIGEDLHMYLKCFFALSGNLKTHMIYAAASQCDVSTDVKGISGYIDGLNARYKQALRHMWGSLDTGFAIRETIQMIQRHRVASKGQPELILNTKLAAEQAATSTLLPSSGPPSPVSEKNWTAFYTDMGLHKSLIPKVADFERVPVKSIHKLNTYTLLYRLFEAHFLPIHLATIMTVTSIYTLLTPSFLIPTALKTFLDLSGWFRLTGFCCMMIFFYQYERYHRLCLSLRQEEMRKAGMLEDMTEQDGFSHRVFQVAGLFETCLFPVGGFIFGAIPATQAVLSHFFTDRLTYVVSLKPQLLARQWQEMKV